MEKKKKKGSGKVLISVGAVLVALAVIVTGACSYFSGVLDTYVGLGEAKVVQKPGSENWDTAYYATDYPTAEEIDKAAKDTTVVTDYNASNYMHVEQGVSSGNDLMLANAATLPTKFTDTNNASTQKVMRQAVKNIVYMHVNSNTVNGLSDGTTVEYGVAPWRLAMYGMDAVLVLAGTALIVLGVRKGKKSVTKLENQ